jgi:hypothetical protein
MVSLKASRSVWRDTSEWIHERTLKTMVKGGVLHHVLVKRYDGK